MFEFMAFLYFLEEKLFGDLKVDNILNKIMRFYVSILNIEFGKS